MNTWEATVKLGRTRLQTSRKKLKLQKSLYQFTDLNDDCLEHVFKRLDIISLVQMCEICDRFSDIITERIIPFRTIVFNEFNKVYSVREMFALFGKSMKRIVVHTEDFKDVLIDTELVEFLKILLRYGEPGKLTDVSLTFGGFLCHIPGHLLRRIWPFFSNVRKLQFDLTSNPMDWEEFAAFIGAIDKKNLRELHVHNVRSVYEWLLAKEFISLQKIHLSLSHNHPWNIDQINALNESCLTYFISEKSTSLVEFECINAPSEGVFVKLSRHIPSIDHVGELSFWSNDAAVNNNAGGGGGIVPSVYYASWEYFSAFTSLKHVSLRSMSANFSDSGEAFSILAKRQTIERLQLTFGLDSDDLGNPIDAADLKQLTRLTTLNLQNFNDDRSNEFMTKLFANLPALTTCTIDGENPKKDRIIELIRMAKNLKVLKLFGVFKSFSVTFYKRLLQLRAPPVGQNADAKNQLSIYVDEYSARSCMRDLRVQYKSNIITLKIN